MFCGVFYFNAHGSEVEESGAILAQRACRYPHQKMELLHTDERFVLYNISRENEPSNEVLHLDGQDSFKSWYIDITGSHLGQIDAYKRQLNSYNWTEPLDLRGQWIALQWQSETSSLKFSTDFLGSVWLYIAKTKKGYLFAQDFAALSGHPDVTPVIVEDNLLVELGLGYIPDNSTIYDEINIIPPGAVIKLSVRGIKTLAEETPCYNGEYERYSIDEKFAFLDKQYEDIYQKAIANKLNESCISLSAGLDSRYALALLQAHNTSCPAYTFGIGESEEVYGARKIAEIAGLSPTCFNFVDTPWLSWRRCIEQLGNIGMIQWVGWAEEWIQLMATNHQYVLIGFLGDAISGKHLIRSDPKQDWITAWINWSLDSWATSKLLREDYRLGIKDHISSRLERILDRIDPIYPHQVAMHLDIYGRQRRWVASQPNLISKFMYPKTYFLNKELVTFWTNLPYADLKAQSLYKAYAQNRYPRYFTKNGEQLTLTSRIQRKFVKLAKGMFQPKTPIVSHVIQRDLIIAQNLVQITELMEKSERNLSHIMDYSGLFRLINEIKKTGVLTQNDAGLILRAVNLMILIDS